MIIVEAGNGAGLTASFNRQPAGALGPRGQVVAGRGTPSGETSVPPKPTASLATPTSNRISNSFAVINYLCQQVPVVIGSLNAMDWTDNV